MSENVRVYLIDRAGSQANAFADKLAGRQGVELVGGAADVDEALEDITDVQPEVILVGTDVGGAGVVSAVERVLTVAGDVAVVALCTRADKALVAAAVRIGAAGSLERTASDIDTITALHVYRDRQHGAQVDMKLAEPPAEKRSLRVSGALPRFPTPIEDVSYLSESPLLGALEMADPVGQETETAETPAEAAEPAVDEASTQAAIELDMELEPEPEPEPQPAHTPQPEHTPPPEYAPPSDPTPAPEYTPPGPAQPDYPVQPETTGAPEYRPPAPEESSSTPVDSSPVPIAELEPPPEATADEAPLEAQATPSLVEEPHRRPAADA